MLSRNQMYSYCFLSLSFFFLLLHKIRSSDTEILEAHRLAKYSGASR